MLRQESLRNLYYEKPSDSRFSSFACFRSWQCQSGIYRGLNASQDTFGFQFTNVPFGLSFHAHTCSV